MEVIHCPCCKELVTPDHTPIGDDYCTLCEFFFGQPLKVVKYGVYKAQLCPDCYAQFFPNGEADYPAFFEKYFER